MTFPELLTKWAQGTAVVFKALEEVATRLSDEQRSTVAYAMGRAVRATALAVFGEERGSDFAASFAEGCGIDQADDEIPSPEDESEVIG